MVEGGGEWVEGDVGVGAGGWGGGCGGKGLSRGVGGILEDRVCIGFLDVSLVLSNPLTNMFLRSIFRLSDSPPTSASHPNQHSHANSTNEPGEMEISSLQCSAWR